jgi:outer membrane lipopolysaccharide assembly protein LptE/RlpB
MNILKIIIGISILLSILSGCGYKAIYSIQNQESFEKIHISEINISGDRLIKQTMTNNLLFLTKKDDDEIDKKTILLIENSIVKEINAKNSKGEATIYSLRLTTNIKLIKNNILSGQRTFNEEFTYNNSENIFELEQYERTIKNNLAVQVTNEILKYLISKDS